MNEAIISLPSTTFAGKQFTRKQLAQVQQTVNDFGHLSLRELGHTLCEHLNLLTPSGKHRIRPGIDPLDRHLHQLEQEPES